MNATREAEGVRTRARVRLVTLPPEVIMFWMFFGVTAFANPHIDAGKDYLSKKMVEPAIVEFNQCIMADPDNVECHWEMTSPKEVLMVSRNRRQQGSNPIFQLHNPRILKVL